MGTSVPFGSELRRRRQEAGLSLSKLALVMNYDKGHLSKVERGVRRASGDLARRCDAMFGAEGELQRLAEPQEEPGGPESGIGAVAVERRKLLLTGVGSLIGLGLPSADDLAPQEGPSLEAPFRAQFDQVRQLGQSTDPAVLLPLIESQTRTVTELATSGGARDRQRLLVLAARFAEYAGWMAQEAGDNAGALGWTQEAVELAQAGGDRDLASYALVRRALVTFYDSDAEQTIALAGRAQDGGLPPRIRGLAAQREAQGHALAGDERACLNSLDLARELLGSADATLGTGPVIGTTSVTDPAAMVTGWCLYDLGRPTAAAETFDRECAHIAPQAFRARTRYGMRRALAHAASGEVEHSCEIAQELLDITLTVPSATVKADIRRLTRELSRFRANRAVRDLQPALARALSPSAR
ncbi:helix-turn-helix domain-containing protein [Streptomyces pinistramenti]|uniref:helix-turn-helix domain-containing protein n=1 Tax=Streptomyces pinistramenti TaxID=2884812 RepID=UPI001D06D1DE|nr:helix-turn-helix transcriptional regulator [Streptomyces pinistramenti]MCB5911802.1 helix-turn-helix domain-containing protein [Streptomyces pinistramenti]